MTVVARIDWIKRQIIMGRRAHLSIGQAQDASKAKYKITLDPAVAGLIPQPGQQAICLALDQLRCIVVQNSATDRGHKHSNGSTEVIIWVTFLRLHAQEQMDAGLQTFRGRSPGEGDAGGGGHEHHHPGEMLSRPHKAARTSQAAPSSQSQHRQPQQQRQYYADLSRTPDPPAIRIRKLPLDLLVKPSSRACSLHGIFHIWAQAATTSPQCHSLVISFNVRARTELYVFLCWSWQLLLSAVCQSRAQVVAFATILAKCRSLTSQRMVTKSAIAAMLEQYLGYADDDGWLRISSPSHRAHVLCGAGWATSAIRQHLVQQDELIDRVRVGDSSRSLDVSCWFLRTRNGNLWASSSNVCQVIGISSASSGRVLLEDREKHVFGEVELPNYMFCIRE